MSIHDHDQDWRQIHISAPDLREAVAEAIRTGEPVSVHTYGRSQELPVGAEVAHWPEAAIAWIATNSDADSFEVPHGWDGGSLASVAALVGLSPREEQRRNLTESQRVIRQRLASAAVGGAS